MEKPAHANGSVPAKRSRVRLVPTIIVIAAALVAMLIVARPPNPTEPSFDMLAYLDAQVANQENNKDVRCWSSTCKLQMFLTGAEIGPQAIAVRIQAHTDLIDSVYREAVTEHAAASVLGVDAVQSILNRRFPHDRDAAGGVKFVLDGARDPINILPAALSDYSDTIEPWRLLHNWAWRHTDAHGSLTLRPGFDQEALHVLCDFLKSYDLAVLQHARQIARAEKLAIIDSSAMKKAFNLEAELAR
jgi:hypothetical protein